MSNALISDVEARAQARRTVTSDAQWRTLAEDAWRRSQGAATPELSLAALRRAHRILPHDALIALALGGASLAAGEIADAEKAFAVAAQAGLAEGWTGLAVARHRLGDRSGARSALAEALRRRVPNTATTALAEVLAPEGWCGLTTTGEVRFGTSPPERLMVDGTPCRSLPVGWTNAEQITVETASGPALGSPLAPRAFRPEGYVEVRDGGIAGWAYYPADPTREAAVVISGPAGSHTMIAQAHMATDGFRPLARPRGFAMAAIDVAALGSPLSVRFADGRALLGSPLDPTLVLLPRWADERVPARRALPRRRAVDVVVPVHGGRTETLACLDSVLASLPAGSRLIVVDDASPDPALTTVLLALAARHPAMRLLRLAENRGFPGAANAGLKAAGRRDAVLLNSDTLVPPGWLDRLAAAAYAAADIGTATPLTNDGTILSYPRSDGPNPMPDATETAALDRLAMRECDGVTVEIPVGVGFCLYLRRDCLDATGPLREDLFAQGYGEETDLCLRARHAGFRNVAVPGVFVAHKGGASFGDARRHLQARNGTILERLHPGYDALVATHEAADPLLPHRRAIDTARWRTGRRGAAAVFVTHAGGGGVDRVIAGRVEAARDAGERPVVLRPGAGGTVTVAEPGGLATPNLRYALPAEWPALLRLLRAERPRRVELHHLLGHDSALAELPGRLRVPGISVVHDYARFCPRIALVSTERRYCGEPAIRGCEDCIADLGSLLEDDPPVRTLIARSARELGDAALVVAPSRDAARRIERHFPGILPTIEPWGDDRALPELSPGPEGPVRHVVAIGAIGVEKGYEILLGCARDARDRALKLRFTVVGFTADDLRLLEAGPVTITGRYTEAEAVELIRAQGAQLAFIPSVWPETWCFALTAAWEAGLPAAVFELGAQAERVRDTGRGWLLPLGLSPARINDALLRLAPARPAGQSPAPF